LWVVLRLELRAPFSFPTPISRVDRFPAVPQVPLLTKILIYNIKAIASSASSASNKLTRGRFVFDPRIARIGNTSAGLRACSFGGPLGTITL